MANIHTSPIDWHEGELKVQSLLHVPHMDNPSTPGLSPHATRLLHISSMLALGTLDDDGRPWTTLLGGQPGFARSLGQSIIGVKTAVDQKYDPVVQLLVGGKSDGEVHQAGKEGRLISALGVHLATRDRIKLAGRVLAGALGEPIPETEEKTGGAAEIQAVFAINQSLGNCPKYMNKKRLIPHVPQPVISSTSLPLCDSALQLLAKADMFFISASNHGSNLSTNHRGGPPGFVRVAKNDHSGVVLLYPELSGNRLYQTLGNLYSTPKAGVIVPDFDSADALYLTGSTEILFGKDATAILSRSYLAVKINVIEARFVRQSLAFRGETGQRSPYNPPLRYLATERALPDIQTKNSRVVYATLLARDMLTPAIARFRFSMSDPEAAGRWEPGQYVAMAFEDELSSGYSHMRDDDPRSLNDDYLRTFTISSPPARSLPIDEFEITIRNVGVVTGFLFKQNLRAGLEVPLRGFGGNFSINQGPNEIVPFVAGGIGITPLLAQLYDLDLKRVRLFWSINLRDVGLVQDTFDRCPTLAASTKVFLSGLDEETLPGSEAQIGKLRGFQCELATRRMLASDINEHLTLSSTWYLCTGTSIRKALLVWLAGKKAIYEDFNY